jgi:hypothetical protein
MLRNQSVKTKTGNTRGVVIITLLLSLFAFSGLDGRGPSREIQTAKTEVVVKVNRCASRTAFYTVVGQRGIFNFYPFRELELLRFQDIRISTKLAATARQNPEVKKFFSRQHQTYPSLSVEEDIIGSLRG